MVTRIVVKAPTVACYNVVNLGLKEGEHSLL